MMKTETLLYLVSSLLLAGVVALSLMDANATLFLWLNKNLQVLPDAFWSNMTFVADTLFAVAVLAVAACFRPAMFNSGLVLLIIGALFVQGLKPALDILRPAAVLGVDAIHIIGPVLKNHSFPSGHSFTALATAGLVSLYLPGSGLNKALLTIIILVTGLTAALSRAAVGAHWPMDILVGSAAGLLFAILAKTLTERINWLQSKGIEWFSATLLFITCVSLIFHDSRYPDTRALCIISGTLSSLLLVRYGFQQWQMHRASGQPG